MLLQPSPSIHSVILIVPARECITLPETHLAIAPSAYVLPAVSLSQVIIYSPGDHINPTLRFHRRHWHHLATPLLSMQLNLHLHNHNCPHGLLPLTHWSLLSFVPSSPSLLYLMSTSHGDSMVSHIILTPLAHVDLTVHNSTQRWTSTSWGPRAYSQRKRRVASLSEGHLPNSNQLKHYLPPELRREGCNINLDQGRSFNAPTLKTWFTVT